MGGNSAHKLGARAVIEQVLAAFAVNLHCPIELATGVTQHRRNVLWRLGCHARFDIGGLLAAVLFFVVANARDNTPFVLRRQRLNLRAHTL